MIGLFGWKPIQPILFTQLSKIKKAIFLFPHTTHWDIVTLLAYVLHYPQFQAKFWVAVDKTLPTKFPGNLMFPKYFKPLCTSYSLEAGNKDKSGAGFIKQAVEQLKDQDEYWLLLNPEGKREKSKWRSGWYALAKELQIPLIVIGLDFTQHYMKCPLIVSPDWDSINNEKIGKVEYLNPETYSIEYSKQIKDNDIQQIENLYSKHINTIEVSLENSKDQIEKLLQDGMGQIVPLYPKLSYVPIRNYTGCPSAISNSQKLIYILILLIILVLLAILCMWVLKWKKYI